MTQRLTVTDSDGAQRQIVTAHFRAAHKLGGPCIVFAGEALSDNVNAPPNSTAEQLRHYAARQNIDFMTYNSVGHGSGSTKSDLSLKDWTPDRARADLQTVLEVAGAERPVLLVTSGLGAAFAPFAISHHNSKRTTNPVLDALMFNPVPADALIDLAARQGVPADKLPAHFNQHGLINIVSPTLPAAFPLGREAYDQLPNYALNNPAREKFQRFHASIVHGGADPVSLPYRDLYLGKMTFASKTVIPDRGRALGESVVVAATAFTVHHMESRHRQQLA